MTGAGENGTKPYPRLLAINRQAFAQAHYEVAYHALAAALHAACDDGDGEHLRDVRTIAVRQRVWIDYASTRASAVIPLGQITWAPEHVRDAGPSGGGGGTAHVYARVGALMPHEQMLERRARPAKAGDVRALTSAVA